MQNEQRLNIDAAHDIIICVLLFNLIPLEGIGHLTVTVTLGAQNKQ